jgi:hypothetical protein
LFEGYVGYILLSDAPVLVVLTVTAGRFVQVLD